MKSTLSRRDLLRSGGLAAAAFAAPSGLTSLARAQPSANEASPLRLGLASYTFRNFTRAQLIGFMRQLNVSDLNAKNVKDHLPQRLRSSVGRRMTDAYHAGSALEAEAALVALAKELDRTHPGAAASLREGLDDTLTVLRLNVAPTLARTLRSTNCIESMISVCREHAGNVKRWRDGQMALRWCAAGMVEAGKQFRRVNGHLHLPTLRAALKHEFAESVGQLVHNDQVSAA